MEMVEAMMAVEKPEVQAMEESTEGKLEVRTVESVVEVKETAVMLEDSTAAVMAALEEA